MLKRKEQKRRPVVHKHKTGRRRSMCAGHIFLNTLDTKLLTGYPYLDTVVQNILVRVRAQAHGVYIGKTLLADIGFDEVAGEDTAIG
jgi:hypothetical protein